MNLSGCALEWVDVHEVELALDWRDKFPRRSFDGQGATTCCCNQSGSGDVDLRGEHDTMGTNMITEQIPFLKIFCHFYQILAVR